MEEGEAVETVEREQRDLGEDLRDKLTSDSLTRPQNRAFPGTEFTTDTDEVEEVFAASENPVFEIDHSGDYSMEPAAVEWDQLRSGQASDFYTELSNEMEHIFGERSVVHFYEKLGLSDDLKMSENVDEESQKYSLWMYINGTPQIVVQGLVPEDKAPELEDRKESKWEVDHYLEEGHYLEEDEIIEQNIPQGQEITDLKNAEPDEGAVEDLEEAWKQYSDNQSGKVSWEPGYAEAYNLVKDMDYSPEDVREFAWNHSELREEKGTRNEQRMGLMLSALMNSSEEQAFALPGFWSLGYRNEGNHIFVEREAPWIGHMMEEGTISVPYGAQLGHEPEETDYETEDLGYLEITEARTQRLRNKEEK